MAPETVDHFRIVRLLGRGGRGEVYLARDTKLGRLVALKVARANQPASLKPFLAEARTTARLSHPNIVTIHAVGEHEGGAYLALEYVEGDTLRERVGSLGPEQTIRAGLAIARALAHAHDEGVLHRDLKPENILIGHDGRPRVVDFGIALLDGETPPRKLQGTPGYLAPEQSKVGPLSPAVDIWALGVVLHELATGRRPTLAATQGAVALSPTTPATLAPLLRRCLELDPTERPSAAEVAAALEALLPEQNRSDPPPRPPYPGLRAYTEEEAGLFFGRDHELDALVEVLRHEPGVVVVGPSGAGKTSLIQAGLIPRLRSQGPLRVVFLRPGQRPLFRMAAAISSQLPEEDESGPRSVQALATLLGQGPATLGLLLEQLGGERSSSVLLVVDQLEELHTRADDPEQRAAFLAAIRSTTLDVCGPVKVVLGLREDRLGQISSLPGGRATLERLRIVPVGCPSEEDLRQALERPLAGTGCRFEQDLAQRMVQAASGEPGALGLLQFASRALWERRDPGDGVLRIADYEALGGVVGALAEHADDVLAGLQPGDIELARHLLLRLVDPEGVRRQLSEQELCQGLGRDADVLRVLRHLADGRLVVIHRGGDEDVPWVELAHGALAARWQRLRQWLRADRGRLTLAHELEQAAQLWNRRGQPGSELWRAEAVSEAQRLLGPEATLSPVAESFLDHSEQRRRAARRWRLGLALVACVLLFALGALVAVGDRSPDKAGSGTKDSIRRPVLDWADRQIREAELARVLGRTDEALARFRSALEVTDSPMGRVLWFRLSQGRQRRVTHQLGARPLAAGFAPDGLLVLTDDRRVHHLSRSGPASCQLPGARPARMLAPLPGGVGVVIAGGSSIGVRGMRGPEHVCEAGALVQLGQPVRAVAVGPARVAVALDDDTVQLLSLPRLAPVRRLRTPARALAFSANGRILASGGDDRVVHLWRGATLERRLPGHPSAVTALAFDSRGGLASGDAGGIIRIWRRNRVEGVVSIGETAVQRLSFADRLLLATTASATWVLDQKGTVLGRSTGRTLAVADGDGRRAVARGSTVVVQTPFRAEARGHNGRVAGVAVTPTGDRIASAGRDGSVRFWDRSGQPMALLRGHAGPVNTVALSADGTRVATGGDDGTVRLWAAPHRPTGPRGRPRLAETAAPVLHQARVLGLAFSRDGRLLASAAADGAVRLWDGGAPRVLPAPHRAAALTVAFSPGATHLASGGADQTLRLWRVATPSAAPQVLASSGRVTGLVFVDDQRLVSASSAGEIAIWTPARRQRRIIATRCGRDPRVSLVPGHVIVASPAGRTRICGLDGSGCEDLHLSAWGIRRPTGVAATVDLAAFSGHDGTVALFDVRGRVPLWWSASTSHPPALLTHRGWSPAPPPPSRWRRRVETARKSSSLRQRTCVWTCTRDRSDPHDCRLELWDQPADRRLWREPLALPPEQIRATRRGCLTLAQGVARLHIDGRGKLLAREGTAIGLGDRERRELLVATPHAVQLFDSLGGAAGSRPVEVSVTALLLRHGRLRVGYADGRVVRQQIGDARARSQLRTSTPGPVTALAEGPRGTLFAGQADGSLEGWDRTGRPFFAVKLHGAVSQLQVHGARLYAGTVVGDSVVLKLEAFTQDYCDLVRQVWRDVPFVWESASAMPKQPPADHRCRDNP